MTKFWSYLLIAGLLCACQPQTNEDRSIDVKTKQAQSTETQSEHVARINGQDISLSELDKPLRLALFDLEWQKYKLRKARLNQLVETASDSHDGAKPFNAELLLEPPFPPRLVLPIDNRPIRGNPKSPIRLSVFCSYQSSHCARLQPVLEQIEVQYGSMVSFAYYDFPQGYHRYAMDAANAVRCAAAQQDSRDFQSSIYGAFDDLNQERFELIGRQLRLDEATFETCLNRKTYSEAIKKDVALSQSLGFGSVPIVLVNGLYIKGPQTLEAYQYYIDHELARLGEKITGPIKRKKSKLPLQLQGTFIGDSSEKSRAIIKLVKTGQVQTFFEGQIVTDGVELTDIQKDRVVIDNQGQAEYILIQASFGQAGKEFEAIDGEKIDADNILPDRVRDSAANGTFRDKSKIILDRNWVMDHLTQQDVLAGHFKPAEHKASGFNLMRLEDVEGNDFYETLGLRPGDVIMQVNDDWLHSGQNPLWDSLRLNNEVGVTIMRRGRPVRYYYQIKN